MNSCVSIIIPVYNVEKLIDRCIDSIINQSYKNLEIILIDDGSIDNSKQKIQEYANSDNRIVILEQSHKGVSAARNLGIDYAHGEYIIFCDADDRIMPDTCEKIVENFNKKPTDICIFGYNIYRNNQLKENNVKQIIKAKNSYFRKIKLRRLFRLQVYVWDKAFKTDFLKNNNIKFAEGLKCAEDVVFCFSAYLKNATYSFLPKALYNYYIDRDGNATWNNENCISGDLKSLQYLLNTTDIRKTDTEIFLMIVDQFISGTVYYLNIFKSTNAAEKAQATLNYLEQTFNDKELKTIKNYKILKKYINNYTKI